LRSGETPRGSTKLREEGAKNEDEVDMFFLLLSSLFIWGNPTSLRAGDSEHPNTYTCISSGDHCISVAGLFCDASIEFVPFAAWEHQTAHVNFGLVDYAKYQLDFQLKY
jgi:hypothetical protein